MWWYHAVLLMPALSTWVLGIKTRYEIKDGFVLLWAYMASPMHDPRYHLLRTRLVRERERAGLTQTALAARLGKPQSYVSKYERGERRLDFVECLDVLHALDVKPLIFLCALIESLQMPG